MVGGGANRRRRSEQRIGNGGRALRANHVEIDGSRLVTGASRFGELEWVRKTAASEILQCGAAQPRLDAVWNQAVAAEPLVPAARRPFYQAEVLTMITINRESNRMLLALSKSIEADSVRMVSMPRALSQFFMAIVSR